MTPVLQRTVEADGLSGLARLAADAYNRSAWGYAVLVTVVMTAAGFALGFLFDAALARLGIARGKVARRE